MARTPARCTEDLRFCDAYQALTDSLERSGDERADGACSTWERQMAAVIAEGLADLKVIADAVAERLGRLESEADAERETREAAEEAEYEARFPVPANDTWPWPETDAPRDRVRQMLSASVGVGSEPEPPRVA